jgi:putative spermidine/putrescine transport system ATP-binding protein
VRNDHLQLGNPAEACPSLGGTVTDVEYQGTHVLLGVEAVDQQGATGLTVMVPEARFAEHPVQPGQAVRLWWQPQQAHALAA